MTVPNTYAYLLGELLCNAERLYGGRDRDWTILGVHFTEENYPHTFFPRYDSVDNEECYEKMVMVMVTQAAVNSEPQARFQLAHEVIHLLSLHKLGGTAPVIEEGLATLFSLQQQEIYPPSLRVGLSGEINGYSYALGRVEQLLEQDAEAIPKLRAVQPSFREMTVDTFKNAGINVSPSLAQDLVETFTQLDESKYM